MTVPLRAATAPAPGDTSALDIQRLYEEHSEYVYLILARMLGPGGPEPADLLHETFIVAMHKFHKSCVESPRAWLTDIAIRVAGAARRKAHIRRLLGMRLPQPTETRRTPENAAEDREEFEAIYAALDKLPAIKRTVFILFEIQGFSGDEIAATLRIPKKTVYTRLFHARREFATHYSVAQRGSSDGRDQNRG